ncbi:MAG: hypothetical protein AAFV51_12885, partial [Pseudomonadota bacterium]
INTRHGGASDPKFAKNTQDYVAPRLLISIYGNPEHQRQRPPPGERCVLLPTAGQEDFLSFTQVVKHSELA